MAVAKFHRVWTVIEVELCDENYTMLQTLAKQRGEPLHRYLALLLEENGLLSASLEAGLDRARHAVLQRRAGGN